MKKKEIGKILLVIASLLLLMWLSRNFFHVKPKDIRDWIVSFGIWAPIVFIVVYTIRPLILFPASILSLAAGLAFGTWEGFIYIILGALGGATVAYYAATLLGAKLLKKPSPRMEKIRGKMEENGFIYVLLLRLLPFLNFDLISYLAGMGKVRYIPFITATALGILPGTFGYVFLGSSLVGEDRTKLYIALALFLIMIIIPLIFKKRMKEWLGLAGKDDK
ncbi:TVP38/TMEM64 family protein [Bacillus sp. KH172YL63]|uniref:TVP38/TMEM64 family protein n=1 Tax=Bacillus sp. KH172YL63 TaxID=2709784 RepID=UPI0013E4839A|nr:TVP38/TMEM64 family protein [Bacillus sp. KH172YL63]BCB02078.1 TVP38/TMEM64 family membrane protein YtxB [Bacillus sp. KH172YL63]